ncbi:MAG: class I SAM-dependent methyltransferase, partial [Nanoarchaeota archaeon]|nr:class I SAM-dependent methyltransferase [Nanoarchaeota archaeon]
MPISVNCNLCGANETEFVTNKVRYDTKDSIVKCKKCGLVYMNPQPSEKELREYYSKKYRDVYSSNKSPKETFEDTLPEANWRVNFLGNYFPKPKKVLDIGCSTGSFLYLLQKKGWEAYGTELHEDYTKFAKKKIGQNIYTGTLNDANFKDNQFDAVTLFHVLEHFSDPFSSLIEIKRVLKKDGLLYLE